MSTLLDIDPTVFQRGSRVVRVSPSPIKFFEQKILYYDWPNILNLIEGFQQWPKRTNCEQLQKIRQCSLEWHDHSPVCITICLIKRKTLSQYSCVICFHSKPHGQLNYKLQKSKKLSMYMCRVIWAFITWSTLLSLISASFSSLSSLISWLLLQLSLLSLSR